MSRRVMSSTIPRREGRLFRNQMCRHGARELDVAHALAAHLGERHLDAALLADDAAVLQALVLAAEALVVLRRTEDLGAEKAVPLRLEGAVVDGLGASSPRRRTTTESSRATRVRCGFASNSSSWVTCLNRSSNAFMRNSPGAFATVCSRGDRFSFPRPAARWNLSS